MSYIPKNQMHIDQLLSNVALNYTPQGFFADQIAPVVKVQKQTDLIKVYSKADLWRINNTARGPATEANRANISVSSDSYVCKNYALRADVTLEDRKNADAAFVRELEQGRAMFLTSQLKLAWDLRVAQQVTTSTNVGTASNVASAWTDNVNSDPISDLETVMFQIEDATAYKPNKIVFGQNPWRDFRRNDRVINKWHKTGVDGGAMNVDMNAAAALLEVDKVMVARRYYNSAEEGQTAVISKMWDDHVLVYYAPDRASVEVPSFMYSFRWAAAGLPNWQVERLPYDRFTKSDGMEIGYYQDEKILDQSLSGLIMYTDSSQ